MVNCTCERTSNRLIAALPAEELTRWQPQLELVDLPAGRVLHEAGSPWSHVYLPTTAIVSLDYLTATGASVEVAAVGSEGVVGAAVFLGDDTPPYRAVVRNAGLGYRMKAQDIKAAFERSDLVKHHLLRYTQALITQMAQTAVCNRHHSVDQQLCRWLLMRLDRLQGNELLMTQELIAQMLGVRREGVTDAALKLQRAGLIRYVRGHVKVLDRAGLEARTCECYAVVKKEYERLLPRGKPERSQQSSG